MTTIHYVAGERDNDRMSSRRLHDQRGRFTLADEVKPAGLAMTGERTNAIVPDVNLVSADSLVAGRLLPVDVPARGASTGIKSASARHAALTPMLLAGTCWWIPGCGAAGDEP